MYMYSYINIYRFNTALKLNLSIFINYKKIYNNIIMSACGESSINLEGGKRRRMSKKMSKKGSRKLDGGKRRVSKKGSKKMSKKGSKKARK